jgi:uncharacterized cysteine cluster protein YcgN (CxxCxxCC family)
MDKQPFWETTALGDMTREQWESLCDGCARCCLHKLQDAYSGKIFYTDVACRLLDQGLCRCRRYAEREALVPDCVVLTPDQIGSLGWLPDTCAYRLLDEGKPLRPWHPLISGDPQSVHLADVSVRGWVVSEDEVHEDDLEDHIIHWVSVE